MSRKLFYIISICLLSFFQKASAQDCVLPELFTDNTGQNMTVFFSSNAIAELPSSSDSPYIVAFSPDGLLVGSVSIASADLQGGQAQMAVWGDDTSSPDVDGLSAGQEITFQLVDGISLYDLVLTFNGANSYVTNGILPVLGASAELNCSVPLSGCMDSNACNYDANASNDDGSCTFAETYLDCNGDCISDSDGDFVCDEFEVLGCQDILALNYNSQATDPDTCDYLGCMDSTYFEFDSIATINDASCVTEIIPGCMDSVAVNYDSTANSYDDSCTFDSGINHIFVSNPIDGFAYVSGSDIIINYEFISDDINLGYTVQFQDFPPAPGGALIRYSLDEGNDVTISPNQIGEVNLGQLSDGNHTLEITLYSNDESPLIPWNPLVQTTVNFSIGPAGCTDQNACNYDSLALANDYSCNYPENYPNNYYDCNNNCLSDSDNDLICDELEVLGCQDITAFNYDSLATDAGFCEFPGCTDILYLEYDQLANTDDGSCQILVVEGCMNQNSFNYDSLANVDDASCYDFVNGCMDTLAFNFNDYDYDGYPNELTGTNGIDVNTAIDDCDFYGCMEPNAENYDPLANINAVSIDSLSTNPCTYVLIPGCMIDTACNYDAFAEVDDGSCLFDDICGDCGGTGPNEGYNCDGICITDTDSDGVCDEFEVVGCIDSLAVNFDALATDAGSCDYLGCTDSLYLEYDSIATIDDSTCVNFIVLGCTDQDYLEYSDTANVDDGSCLTIIVPGCTDSSALNYDESANEDDGSCYVFGCLDPFAQNTDTLANIDDGSCTYESVVDTVGNSDEDCEIPIPTSINTGANMTVMLTPAVISSFPDNLDEDAYLVAIANNSGLIVGSVSVYDVEQSSIAVWGDDSVTPDLDGAEAGEIIYFQLVNGNEIFDVSFTLTTGTEVSYTTNAIIVAINSSVSLNCSSGGGFVQTCDIPSDSVINTGANMTVMLTSAVMSSFPDNLDEDAYMVAIANNSGLIVGSVSIYDVEQTSIAVWGDDSVTPDLDGAEAGEIMYFQLVNGNELFDVSFTLTTGTEVSYTTNAIIVAINSSVTLNCNSSGGGTLIIGCMHPTACNYDFLATSPSSCIYSDPGYNCDNNCIIDTDGDGVCDEFEVEGCFDPFADNYNYLATDSVTCNYLGCMDTFYLEYNPIATINEGCVNLIVYGCMDSYADNYNPDANFSNGSCSFENITNPYIEVLFNSDIPVNGYLEGEEIFIEYIFHGGDEDVIVDYPSADPDAVIRWQINGVPQNTLFEQNNMLSIVNVSNEDGQSFTVDSSFHFENGLHSIQFILYDYISPTSTELSEPLVQTTINFAVGPSGCMDPLAGNYSSTAVIDNGSCVANAELDFDSQVINTGSNQTIFIPSDIVFPEGIDFQSDVDLLGAFYLNNGNYVLGSEMVFGQNATDGSFQITIWGDDSSTPEADGFLTGQEFIWALQYAETGNSLFLEPTYLEGYADNTFISDGYFSITSFNVINGFAGCNDELYIEYNPQAIAEDPNLCVTLKVYGCINSFYMEYDPLANTDTDDTSCLTPVLEGCTNVLYLEYDSSANIDDGSCQIEVVEGCIDTLADNYDPLANTQTEMDICIYDICVQLDVNNFNIEYSDVTGEIMLSFDITNTSEDKTIFAPDFEIELSSTEIELDTLNYNYPVIYPFNVATVQAVITNDSLSIELDSNFELLSGIVTLTSDNVVNGLSPTANCSISFTDEMLLTNHLGCTNSSAFNYEEEATIDNGSCVDDVNAVVVSNDPLCHNDYGAAFLYLTGGMPPYSLLVDNMDSYTSYSEFGIPTEVPVTINDLGVVEFEGLAEGVYPIEVTDDLGAVFVDSITITLPPELEVIADQDSDLLLTSSVMTGEAVFYQWLLDGESVQGANSNVHYPQDLGGYQVYIEDVYGCSDYSEEIEVTAIGLQELNEHSFTIYPNPAHSSISLNLSQLNSLTLLSITDVLGQELNKVILDSQSSDVDYSIDISEWPNGLYFINVENNSNQIVKRFVKY